MALQWTPLRLIVTRENGGVERRRSDITFNDYRQKGVVRMLDKEVQVHYSPEIMDYDNADSGLGGSGDLATVTVVEINSATENRSSPFNNNNNDIIPADFSSNSINNNSDSSNNNNINTPILSESNVNQHDHNDRIIRRDSIDRLHELQENNEGDCLADAADYATLPADCRINSVPKDPKADNDVVDEIRDPSLVMLNNTSAHDEKLKELSEKSDDSNCALDCLSFTIQCCDCTIL